MYDYDRRAPVSMGFEHRAHDDDDRWGPYHEEVVRLFPLYIEVAREVTAIAGKLARLSTKPTPKVVALFNELNRVLDFRRLTRMKPVLMPQKNLYDLFFKHVDLLTMEIPEDEHRRLDEKLDISADLVARVARKAKALGALGGDLEKALRDSERALRAAAEPLPPRWLFK